MNSRAQDQRSFGSWLRQQRRALDLTQAEFASQVGCSAITLRKLEAEERRPSKQIAERLADVLHVPAEGRADFLRFARGDPFAAPGAALTPSEPAPARRHNLPSALTRFIGREREIGEIRSLLSAERLVTLTGAGGAGKTRLSQQVAAGMVDAFPDGVWLVELAPLADPALVPHAVARVLGVRGVPGRSLSDLLVDHLRSRHLLLLLDNCEHLIQACAELADKLLGACPRLTLLATSREGLAIPGEAIYLVPSLSLPLLNSDESLERMAQFEAVQLFAERARGVLPGFKLARANSAAVAQICRNLDGIPLAIELAAARLKTLEVNQIAARLDDRFRLLTGGSRTALPRHQTLQALIDWSHELLSPSEQALLRRLAVFAGGWTLGAAEGVCATRAGGPSLLAADRVVLHQPEVLDLLASLVNKSLVLVERRPDSEPRYRMLETVRQYAFVRLAGSGEADEMRQRHALFYLRLAEVSNASGALERLAEQELDNLRAAAAWSSAEASDPATGLHLAGLLDWYVFGDLPQTRQALETALARADEAGLDDPPARAAVLSTLGDVLALLGQYHRGRERMTESLALYQALGDRPRQTYVLNRLGWLAREHGDGDTARRLLEASLALARELGDKELIAVGLVTLGEVFVMLEDTDQAQSLLDESLAGFRQIRQDYGTGWALNHLGQVALLRGQYQRARRLQHESLALFQPGDDPRPDITRTAVQQSLGEIELAQGHAAEAAQTFALALESAHTTHDPAGVAWCLSGLAGAAVLDEAPERAAQLWGAAEALRQKIGARHAPASRANRERLMGEAREQLGEEAFHSVWAEGEKMTMEQAVALAREARQ